MYYHARTLFLDGVRDIDLATQRIPGIYALCM
jgi:hypothetical protein